jgi:hypothetical protein
MNQDRWRRIEQLFDEAAAMPAAERRLFLDRRAANDATLKAEVWKLLEAHDSRHPLLDAGPPRPQVPATLDPELPEPH